MMSSADRSWVLRGLHIALWCSDALLIVSIRMPPDSLSCHTIRFYVWHPLLKPLGYIYCSWELKKYFYTCGWWKSCWHRSIGAVIVSWFPTTAVAGSVMFSVCPSVTFSWNISDTPSGNFFKFGTNVHLDLRVNWFDFCDLTSISLLRMRYLRNALREFHYNWQQKSIWTRWTQRWTC